MNLKPLYFIVFAVILLIQPAGAQSDSLNQTDPEGRKHGPWIKTWGTSDVPRYKGQFDHGKPVGEFKYYYPDGKLKAVNTFRERDSVAYARLFHPNGEPMAEGKYVGREKDSLWVFYNRRGILTSKGWYEEGKKHGKTTVFFNTGKEAEITHYKQGVKHGPWKQYFKNGNLKAKGTFRDGNLIGKVTYYHSTGKKMFEGKYKAAVKHGVWVRYDSEGVLERVEYYKWGDRLQDKNEIERFKENLREQGKWDGVIERDE